ncbi:MAG TPA: hypothetical protein VMZ92_11335 [Planctomycetota bacterium]|nr:hypothetical protein [Planctomycetota bacterium]
MRFAGVTVLSGLLLAGLLGCEAAGRKAVGPAQVDASAVAAGRTDRLPPPRMEGEVFRVWRFQNGELMALLGWKDGLCKGDILLLTRGGDTINAIEVLKVDEETFFGRVFERQVPELLPQVGDFAVRPPAVDEPVVMSVEPEATPSGKD